MMHLELQQQNINQNPHQNVVQPQWWQRDAAQGPIVQKMSRVRRDSKIDALPEGHGSPVPMCRAGPVHGSSIRGTRRRVASFHGLARKWRQEPKDAVLPRRQTMHSALDRLQDRRQESLWSIEAPRFSVEPRFVAIASIQKTTYM
jgi:hypothetical protein